MQKICRKCGVLKPLEQFHTCKKAKDGHRKICGKCINTFRKPKRTASMQARRQQARIFILNHWRDHPCIACGETDPRCLTFDHINPETKTNSVSVMVAKGAAISTILTEINKCQVLCSNCHAKKTSDQFGYYTSDPEYMEGF